MNLPETYTNHSEPEPGGWRHHWRDRKMFWYWILAGFILAQLFFFKIGVLEIFLAFPYMALVFYSDVLGFFGLSVLIAALFYPSSVIFYVWTWRGNRRDYIPRRSVALFLLLCLTFPYQLSRYFENPFDNADEFILTFLNEHPNYATFEFLDCIVLLGLGVWLIGRRRAIRPWDFLVFHFFLFVALIWSMKVLQAWPTGLHLI